MVESEQRRSEADRQQPSDLSSGTPWDDSEPSAATEQEQLSTERPAGEGRLTQPERSRSARADRDSGRETGSRPKPPELPEELADVHLDAEVRRDLRGLRKDVADDVARHLVAAGTLLEADPQRALAHARYARGRASRLAVVREAVGLAAYRAGEWAEAIAELRAARRMGGGPGHLAVMADAERALGRPERALELARGPEARDLDQEEAIELLIVTSGARRDLNEPDAAVLSLQVSELDPRRRAPWSARLFYAYADALLAAGRHEEAVRWFLHAEDADDEGLTDAAERLAELAAEQGSPAGFGAEAAESEAAGLAAEVAGPVTAELGAGADSAVGTGKLS